jgi:hypothetical protein
METPARCATSRMLTVAGRRRSPGLSFEVLTLERFYTLFLVFLSRASVEFRRQGGAKLSFCLGFGMSGNGRCETEDAF